VLVNYQYNKNRTGKLAVSALRLFRKGTEFVEPFSNSAATS
jgi:hypothetical protein